MERLGVFIFWMISVSNDVGKRLVAEAFGDVFQIRRGIQIALGVRG
jgi:hypothetical protein